MTRFIFPELPVPVLESKSSVARMYDFLMNMCGNSLRTISVSPFGSKKNEG